ncbi:DUF2931 family protein [Flavobacterium sp.]|uniref:DUF2931 family protein n=1 Tax=Flavobacterium sp. TaxID=239 RepID=UPI002C502CCB|nr:DUF2931 family protein [Flavobacterium sp.]HSD06671.1 DUF2931 family protein [Flavobacterium sp.]
MKYFEKREDIINGLLTILLLIILVANAVQKYNYKADERFEWSSGVLSSKGNVVQVSGCYFYHTSYLNYVVDKKSIIDDGWDDINYSEESISDAFYPDSLSISWFSYNEKKFYEGKFVLPYKIILQKAKQLRMAASQDENNFTVENSDKIHLSFLAEILPKGKLVVWISNDDKNLKIGKYQAKIVNATWHVFDDSHETDTTSNIDIPTKVALVMERCPYTIEVKLPSGFHLRDSDFIFFNQNHWYFDSREPEKIPVFYGIPDHVRLSWGNGKKEFSSQFVFKEDEILNFFRTLKVQQNQKPLLLELKINNTNDSIHATLKNANKSLKILPSYMEVYPLAVGNNVVESK